MIGVTAGIIYSKVFLRDQGPIWMVAVAAIGAILGYLLVLMPAALVHYTRLMWARLSLVRLRFGYRRLLARAVRAMENRVTQEPSNGEAWNSLGVLFMLAGERIKALSALERAYSLNGVSAGVNLAAVHAEHNDFAEAADLLINALQQEETAQAALHNVGVLLSRKPPLPVAQELIERLPTLDSPHILNALGIYELAAGNLNHAERYFARAVELDPSAVAPRSNLALVQFRRGRISAAVNALHEAALLDPLNAVLVNDLGALLCAGGQPLAAARALGRAAALAPGSPAVELNRGVVRFSLGRYADAQDSFTDPVIRTAYPIEAVHDNALALIGLGRLNAALEQLEEGLEEFPEDVSLRNNLACVAWALGDDERMAEEFALIQDVDEPAPMLNAAIARIDAGDPEGALALLDEISSRGIEDDACRFVRGLAYLSMALRMYSPEMTRKQRDEFFRQLHRCVRPFETISEMAVKGAEEAAVNLALYRYLRREYEAAAEAFLEVATKTSENGYLYFCAGTALAEAAVAVQRAHEAPDGELVGRARELFRRARQHLETAVDLGEATADVFCNLGMCAYNLGDLEGALAAFRRMYQLEESADAANALAIAHAKEGQRLQHEARGAALASAEREREMIQKAQTHLSTALHYFFKALEHSRDDPILHGNIGLAYMMRNRSGDVDAALRHWQRMQALGGAEARKRYEELTALAYSGEKAARARFDETIMAVRPLDPHRCMTTIPPHLVGPRYALQSIAEDTYWQLLSQDPLVQKALRMRDRVAGMSKRVMRLSL